MANTWNTGFISRNNPDETAKNFFQLNAEAKVPRKRTVTWNIVPWYIGDSRNIRAVKRTDLEQGLDFKYCVSLVSAVEL